MIELPRALAEDFIAHARADAPNEVCGLVGVRDGRIVRLERARNAAPTPRVRFEIDSRDVVKVIAIEAAGLEVGFYHSHPASPAYPSPTDVRFARLWPGALQLMISLRHDLAPGPELHAYRIEGDVAHEEVLRIVDGPVGE